MQYKFTLILSNFRHT